MEEFLAEFKLYVGPLQSAKPEYLKGIFINGLKDVIKEGLKLHDVDSLQEMKDSAQRNDDRNKL